MFTVEEINVQKGSVTFTKVAQRIHGTTVGPLPTRQMGTFYNVEVSAFVYG